MLPTLIVMAILINIAVAIYYNNHGPRGGGTAVVCG